ncbi:cation diffusion facilitator family transporter [Phytoactinopolyspora halotolerans]|uniref:Cation diffusion facilitator family transporter n=1 Tax=Phytoactinopolyspora halotolerans TaxID=1981512 RepID=A0A6L9SH04_9ACTN|nr:cation diffusion facilitator family transporter [Phytoactinopolyspora halotolerans]NEE03888.1 cation diffusion facilitator family transporter [Phytoactinopolyspora halotolerans]
MATEGGTKAVLAALLANVGIAVTKFVAWALTGASSMLAEAIHSVADSGNQVLLLVGGRRAQRKATPEHPFGYGRVRYVFAFIVSIVLFSVGGLFALYEAFHKYEEVHAGYPNELLESSWWWVPVVVLSAAIVMETLSFRTAIRESDKVRGKRSWVQFVRRAKSPELPVILLEDLGALVGLVLALAGVGMSLITENAYWDVAGTAAIGLLLVVIAVILAVEMSSLLIGEGAVQEKVNAIAQAVGESESVTRLIHMRTLYTGPEELLVAAKFGVSAAHTGEHIAATIDDVEARIRRAVPEAVHIYLEPDLDRTPRGTGEEPGGSSARSAQS